MKKNFTICIFLTLTFFVQAQEKDVVVPAANVKLVKTLALNVPSPIRPISNSVTANALYSNVTNFLGYVYPNGGAATTSGNTITKLVADDITMVKNTSYVINYFQFSVGNLNTVAVTARARVRFYADNAGVPGAYITGYSFNPISFPVGVSVYNTTVAEVDLTQQKIWAGITFDDNTGTTGATIAQLNNLGSGFFNPVDQGSSADLAFTTTAAGSFLANAPAGTTFNFSGSPVTNFGWELVSSTPLPISLTSFDAVKSGKANILSWVTEQESNSSQFVVERSADASSYQTIGSVAAKGTSSTPQNYTFTDAQPTGTSYYRLKLMDKDGTFTYSKVVQLSNGQLWTSVYPNPAKNMITVNVYNTILLNTKANIYDGSGKLVKSVQITNNQQQINVQPLSKGVYMLNFIDGTSQRFMKD